MIKEFSAKTVEDAIEKGLEYFSLRKEEVEIQVIEEKKGLFSKKAKILMSVKEEVEERLLSEKEESENYLAEKVKTTGKTEEKKVIKEKPVKKENASKTREKSEKVKEKKEVKEDKKDTRNLENEANEAKEFIVKLLAEMNLPCEVEIKGVIGEIEIELKGDNSSAVIGYRGEVLDAIQSLASAVANKESKSYIRLSLNCEDYREKREETLKLLAQRLANKAVTQNKKVRLEPMNPYERRIIHSSLAGSEEVETYSEGEEPKRYIVIVPKNYKDNRKKGFKKDYGNKGRNKNSGFQKESRPKAYGVEKRDLSSFSGTFLGKSESKPEDNE